MLAYQLWGILLFGIGATVHMHIHSTTLDPRKAPKLHRGKLQWYEVALRVVTTHGFMAGGLWMIVTTLV